MLLLCLLVGGVCCSCSMSFQTPPEQGGTTGYDDSLITELISDEGNYEDQYNRGEYAYRVPQLRADSPDAQQINAQIQAEIGSQVEAAYEEMEQGLSPTCTEVKWESHWKDSLLCLVIEARNGNEDNVSYLVCCYDFDTEIQVDNHGLLDRLGVSETAFFTAARRAAIQRFDEDYRDVPNGEEYLSFYYGEMIPCRQTTLAAVDLDSSLLYLDGDTCYRISEISTAAGSGMYYAPCALVFQPQTQPEKQVENEFITATLRNGEVTLSFADTQQARLYLRSDEEEVPSHQMAFDTEYPVDGLYGDYTDLFIGEIGQDYVPYLILTTRQGTLECVNILHCAQSGVFCAYPMPGIQGVISLSYQGVVDTDEQGNFCGGHQTIYAESGSEGPATDLSNWTWWAGQSLPSILREPSSWNADQVEHRLDSGGSYSSLYCLEFSKEEGRGTFRMDEIVLNMDISTHYEGRIEFLGMTDAGVICGYELTPEDGKGPFVGTFAMKFHEMSWETLCIQTPTGPDLFDAGEGGETAFLYAVG